MRPHQNTHNHKQNYNKPHRKQSEEVMHGLSVKVYNNDVQKALRKLKKKVQNDGKLVLIRERQYYEKPSAKRKKAKDVGIKRYKKEVQANQVKRKRLY
jgi:small subunit ribosomal protein S21